MTTKYMRSSEQLHFTATAALTSGLLAQVGDTVGVAADDYAIGDAGILGTMGTFGPLPCASADDIGEGVDLYFHSASGELRLIATAAVYAGKAASAAGVGVTTVDLTLGLPEAA